MFKRFAAPLIIASVASAAFFACSSDSNSSGPAEDTSATSSSSAPTFSSDTAPESSSDMPATPESSSIAEPESSSDAPTSSSSTEHQSSSAAVSSSSNSQVTEPAEVYFWNDEFDTIDTTKWTFEIGTGASGWGNNERQYYTGRSENAYVQDGILHIRANKEDYEGAKYTSARMITKGKFSFTYGTVEARIALPMGKGIWPAFWTLGENIDAVSWPACGEIDIIEAVNSESIVYGTNHWQSEGNQADYGNNTNDFHGAKKELDITQFHNYKMVWNSEVIAMYVDDFKYHEISIKENAGGTDAFHKPQVFLLNVAVAGNWPGFEVDDAQFPNEMLVDYIRVSQ